MNILRILSFAACTLAIASTTLPHNAQANTVMTRHAKALNIKQTVYSSPQHGRQNAVVNGVSTPYLMTGSLVTPSLHAGVSGVGFVVNEFAGTPLPTSALSGSTPMFPVVQRFNYEAFWSSMAALRACESAIEQTYQSAYDSDSDYAWYSRSAMSHFRQHGSKELANRAMASYPGPYNGVRDTLIDAACPHNVEQHLAAAMTRQHVNNYAHDSLQALDYVTSYFWIRRQGAAHALRQRVLDYINEHNIESAWIDLEFEYTASTMFPTGDNNRRISMSFNINKNDIIPRPLGCGTAGGVVDSAVAFCGNPVNGTRGQSLGSAVVLPPNIDSVDLPLTVRDNTILIRYSAKIQYPDFFVPNGSISAHNISTANNATPSDVNNWGVLSWVITRNTAPVAGQAICEGVPNAPPNSVCDNVSGNGRVQLRTGSYDPQFEVESEFDDGTFTSPPVMVIRTDPLNDESFRCLIRGEGNACSMDIHNVSSLMQLSNSIEGRLEYTGRWEVDTSRPQNIRELARDATFNVCRSVGFANQLEVEYTVRRPRHIIKLNWSDTGFINYELISSGYITENITLPDRSVYTTFGTPHNNNNLIGSFGNPDIRANTNMPLAGFNSDSDEINSYLITYVPGRDPAGLNLRDWEGAVIADPFISYMDQSSRRLLLPTRARLAYRDLPPPGEASPIRSIITQYALTGINYSNSLPRDFQNVDDALSRSAEFRCAAMNEHRLDQLATAVRNPPPSRSGFLSQGDALAYAAASKPTGIYPGSIFAHVDGTRPTYSDSGAPGTATLTISEPCQVSYLDWNNVQTQPVATSYTIPDPNWVPPAACSQNTTPIPTACTPPQVTRWTGSLNIVAGGPLTYETSRATCFETCEIGGPTQICERPHE